MPIDAVIRVSFDGEPPQTYQAVNRVLVGNAQDDIGPGLFVRPGTHLFHCPSGDATAVAANLAELVDVIRTHATSVDFLSITLVRHRQG
jgi:hypothetical protein